MSIPNLVDLAQLEVPQKSGKLKWGKCFLSLSLYWKKYFWLQNGRFQTAITLEPFRILTCGLRHLVYHALGFLSNNFRPVWKLGRPLKLRPKMTIFEKTRLHGCFPPLWWPERTPLAVKICVRRGFLFIWDLKLSLDANFSLPPFRLERPSKTPPLTSARHAFGPKDLLKTWFFIHLGPKTVIWCKFQPAPFSSRTAAKNPPFDWR